MSIIEIGLIVAFGFIVAEIAKNKGTQFDPEIADAFLFILRNDYNSILEIQNKYK